MYKPKRILFVPDTQVRPGIDTSHIEHAGKYIVDKKPDVIVVAGDWWDFPSLSSYDRGTIHFEGRRLKEDIQAGRDAMGKFLAPLKELQQRQQANRKKVYQPRMVFLIGNHCERLLRISKQMPEFSGFIGYELLGLEKDGWEVHDFLEVVEIDGIFFTHYLSNPFTGRPYGGTAINQLKTIGRSFVVGHKQTLDIAVRPTIDGKMQLGVVAGSFYTHNENYKGPQGNNHFRGMVMLNDVKDGYGDLCLISIDYLRRKYGTD